MKKLIAILILFCAGVVLATSTGEQAPASSAQMASPSTAWTNIDSVFANDDEYAVYTGGDQDSLYITNFTMGVTAGATIDSIFATGRAFGTATQPARRRLTCFLVKDGTTAVGESVSFQFTQDTESSSTLTGGTTPLWNTTWTAAEVNASTFGIVVWKTADQAGNINVDQYTIRIVFTEAGGDISYVRRIKEGEGK